MLLFVFLIMDIEDIKKGEEQEAKKIYDNLANKIKRKKFINKKEIKRNLILLISVIIIFLIILEILLRLLGAPVYGFEKDMFVYNELTGYRLTPGFEGLHSIYGKEVSVKINVGGLRDDMDHSYAKPEGKFRILVLGDSFSFGNGVTFEESYFSYLRQEIKDGDRQDIGIINLGVPGYDIHNEVIYYLDEGFRYDPDVILLQFALNDWGNHQIILEDNWLKVDKSHSLIANEDGILVDGQGTGFIRSIHLGLLKNIRTYSFFYSGSRNLLSPIVNKFWGSNVPTYFLDPDSEEYQEAYDGYKEALQLLDEKTDAKIVLFIGPAKEDLISSEEIQKTYNLDYETDTKQVRNSVLAIADELGLKSIVLEFGSPDLFIEVDGHWTSEGNQLVAENIYEKLKELNVI